MIKLKVPKVFIIRFVYYLYIHFILVGHPDDGGRSERNVLANTNLR